MMIVTLCVQGYGSDNLLTLYCTHSELTAILLKSVQKMI